MLLHSSCLPLPADAEMDTEGRCRIAARHGQGRRARAPSSPQDPWAPGRACRARFRAHPCLSTKVRVPGRPRSRAHWDAGHLTRKAVSFFPPLVGQGKWRSDLNALLQDHRAHPAPTGREARRHQNSHLIRSSRGPLSSPEHTWVRLITLWGKASFQRNRVRRTPCLSGTPVGGWWGKG